MKQKTDARVDAYIAGVAEFARPILQHLRSLVHSVAPEVEETIKWNFPFFQLHGRPLCHMAAFKEHCVFGAWHQQVRAMIVADGAKAQEAMGRLDRITSLAGLPADKVMRRYLTAAVKFSESGTPARPRPKPKPALTVPADLKLALSKNKAAAATFEKFSPSNRREYIEWIIEAKRAETREQRLLTTVEWLAKGKARNWKYQNC